MSKLKTDLLGLSDELFRAELYYGISKALRENTRSDGFKNARNLFMGSYYACLREALLSLSKILISDADSVSIPYLVNYSEQNTGDFSCATQGQIREAVTSFRTELRALEPTIVKLKPLRDHDLAHLDKKRVDEPDLLIPSPIDFVEIERCLAKSFNILHQLMNMHDGSSMSFQDIGQVVRGELEEVLSVLAKPR